MLSRMEKRKGRENTEAIKDILNKSYWEQVWVEGESVVFAREVLVIAC